MDINYIILWRSYLFQFIVGLIKLISILHDFSLQVLDFKSLLFVFELKLWDFIVWFVFQFSKRVFEKIVLVSEWKLKCNLILILLPSNLVSDVKWENEIKYWQTFNNKRKPIKKYVINRLGLTLLQTIFSKIV